MKLCLICVVLLFLVLGCQSPIVNVPALSYTIRTEETVYKETDEGPLTLVVDLPQGDGPFPVIVYVHSWSGTAGQLQQHSQSMARDLGIAGVRINYRKMSQDHTYAQAMADLQDALAFVRENASRYGFDLQRMGLAGASAGALLSSVVVQHCAECKVYVAFNGGFDLLERGDSNFLNNEARLQRLMGGTSREQLLKGSAIHQIRRPAPATLLMHGTADKVIDCNQAVRFAAAIREHGARADVKLYEGAEHGFFNANMPYFPDVIETMKAFLAAELL